MSDYDKTAFPKTLPRQYSTDPGVPTTPGEELSITVPMYNHGVEHDQGPAVLGNNPKDITGIKKPSPHLVPPASILYQSLGMADGAEKYGPYNWRENKVIASIYISATIRHLLQWFDGEELAKDSKLPHLAHAISDVGIIIDALETGNLIDDRPIAGSANKVIEKWTKK